MCILDSRERKIPWGHMGVVLLMTVQMCATVSYGLMYQILLLPSSLPLVIFQMSSFQNKVPFLSFIWLFFSVQSCFLGKMEKIKRVKLFGGTVPPNNT